MTPLKTANLAYIGVIHILAYFSIFLLAIITGWISLEVISRIIGTGVLRGSVEFTEYAIFNMAFLAAPWILHKNAHVRVLVLTEQLSERRRQIFEKAVNFFAAAACLILTYYAGINLIDSVQRAEFIFGELVFPEWYVQWQVPLAFSLLSIGFLKLTFGSGPANLLATAIKV
jgi:TRAP-type C4-dicarboxylate transport system permease small subunit